MTMQYLSTPRLRRAACLAAGWLLLLAALPAGAQEPKKPAAGAAENKPKPAAKVKWVTLFNGKNLDGWKIPKFGGDGEVSVKDGQLLLGVGNPLTGANYTGKIPKIDYEVQYDARRVSGSDFFCGLTFPVGKSPCSLILGGWGGGLCGLSSINGMDASENATTSYMEFKKGRWYHVRLRVMSDRIQAWVDKKQIVDQVITDRQIDVRLEVDLSRPFGFASYQTTGALKNIRLRKLTKAELAAARKKANQ